MHSQLENIKTALQNPTAIRYNEEDESVAYFYKEFKDSDVSEKYLLVSVKYLNGEGYIATAFVTRKLVKR